MFRRTLVLAGVTVAAVLLTTAAPSGAAVRPFDPPQTVVGGCGATSGDAVSTTSGALVGFAGCPSGQIRFFSRNPDRTVNSSEASGFSGRVMAVTADATATYVLFNTSGQVRIGKRTNAGAFSSRMIDTSGGAVLPTGDIVARGGQWFGVWDKQVGPGGEFAQTELFSGGSAYAVQRITTTGPNIDDREPTLAYSGVTPILIWSRVESPAIPGPSDLLVSKFIAGTWQATRLFATAGTTNANPDMAIAGGHTFVTWSRDGYIVVASNPGGVFSSHRFNTGGLLPRVAVSTTSGVVDHAFVTWTAFAGLTDTRGFFAETAGVSVQGTWSGTYVSGLGTRVLAGTAHATKGTTVYASSTLVAARSQA
jgi:hypothetical protein